LYIYLINNITVNVRDTSVYKEYLAMREEVNKHKWYESEKAGHDIGFPQAVIDWTLRFKASWLKNRKLLPTPTPCC
jgi:hypothetical protein